MFREKNKFPTSSSWNSKKNMQKRPIPSISSSIWASHLPETSPASGQSLRSPPRCSRWTGRRRPRHRPRARRAQVHWAAACHPPRWFHWWRWWPQNIPWVANYPRIVSGLVHPSDFSGLTLQKSHVNHWGYNPLTSRGMSHQVGEFHGFGVWESKCNDDHPGKKRWHCDHTTGGNWGIAWFLLGKVSWD